MTLPRAPGLASSDVDELEAGLKLEPANAPLPARPQTTRARSQSRRREAFQQIPGGGPGESL